MLNLIHYQDNGHGWIGTTMTELEILGIADDISPCSYRNGHSVFLEEDRDANLYLNALDQRKASYVIKEKHINGFSWIRNLPPYRI